MKAPLAINVSKEPIFRLGRRVGGYLKFSVSYLHAQHMSPASSPSLCSAETWAQAPDGVSLSGLP